MNLMFKTKNILWIMTLKQLKFYTNSHERRINLML